MMVLRFFISDTELHFGSQWYVTAASAAEDNDGDSVIELVWDELKGLVGTKITGAGHMQSEN